MRKINLESYKVKVPHFNKGIPVYDENGDLEMVYKDYRVKEAIIDVMFHQGQQLGRDDIRIRNKIADKIEAAEKEIYLENSEFDIINNAFGTFKGFKRNEDELNRRIDEAETVTPEQLMKKG